MANSSGSHSLIFLLQEVDREIHQFPDDLPAILRGSEEAARNAQERVDSLEGQLSDAQTEVALQKRRLTEVESELFVKSDRLRRSEINLAKRERDRRISRSLQSRLTAETNGTAEGDSERDLVRAARSLSRATRELNKATDLLTTQKAEVDSGRPYVQDLERLAIEMRAEALRTREEVRYFRSSYGRLLTLEREREGLVSRLGVGPIYERARQNSDGQLMASVRGTSCSGCLEPLDQSILSELRSDKTTRVCPFCGRVLSVGRTAMADEVAKVDWLTNRSTLIRWEILPEGWWNDPAFVEEVKRHLGDGSRCFDVERLQMLATLKPVKTYAWLHMGHRRYFVFEFDRVAIAECVMWGNAMYLTGVDDWRRVFKLSKREAVLAGALRIPHNGSWFERVKQLLS